MKNFRIIENKRTSFDDIYDEFKQDYLDTSMKNEEIRLKYNLTHGEFSSLTKTIKKECNIIRRKTKQKEGKHYYKCCSGFSIQKRVNGVNTYFGTVPTIELAKIAVNLCEKLNWQVNKCKVAIWELKLCNTA